MISKKRKMKIDKSVNRDVVLCETTNHKASKCTADALMHDSIPFTRVWKRVPFFKREDYKGASEVCVIKINRNEYSRARASLDRIDAIYKSRLLLNII